MKRIIMVLLIAFSGSLAITSCTEERVEPTSGGNNGSNTGGSDQTGRP